LIEKTGGYCFKATRFFYATMVYIIIFLAIVFFGLYMALISRFRTGWHSLQEVNTNHFIPCQVFVSVVVPFRNEAQNIRELICNINSQRFAFHYLEVVMADDHSTDKGMDILTELQQDYTWLKVVSSEGHGKKAALRRGISSATGELIITTDADCRFEKDWLQTITETYVQHNPDMIVMPVAMEGKNKIFDKFQQTDYLSLQMVTAGAFGIGKPIISSGANLAFKKKSFLETGNFVGGQDFLSGDDVFLLHAFKGQNFKTIYLKSAQAMVKTIPAGSVPEFLLQRIRWGGKSRGYKDTFAIITTLVMLTMNTYVALLPVLSVFNIIFLWIGLAAILAKATTDWWFLNAGNHFFSVRLKPWSFLIFSLIYPYYILVAFLGSILLKEKWKDRKGK